jgi:hypothetical protein
MQFYTKQHKYYCGIDLHTKKMFNCILDEKGDIREHRNLETNREPSAPTLITDRNLTIDAPSKHCELNREKHDSKSASSDEMA